ncbi:MAG: hypothetical protein SNG79_01440 [Rikenellaceae bacterium]
MKRHEQTTGVRKWSGDDLLELQGEALTVLDGFFAQYGDVVVNGCAVSGGTIASGLVNIGGKVMPFAGATGITTYPIYLVSSVSTEQREYVDGAVKDIAKVYTATTTQTKPTSDYLEIPSDGSFTKFFDKVDSTWLTDLKTRLTAVEAYDTTVAAALATLSASKEDHLERIVDLEEFAEDAAETLEDIDMDLDDHEERIYQLEITQESEAPTLTSVPSASTTTYTEDGETFSFVIGQQCRVYNSTSGRYVFYQLYSLVNGVATWQIVKTDCSTTSETVNVNLFSNQGSYDESLVGVTVSVSYSGTTLTGTWSGLPLTFIVPQGASCTVSATALSSYSSPSSQSFTTVGGNEREVIMNYSCERVVVSLTSDGDASLTAQTVTIKNSSTGATIGSGTGEQVIVKVPTGTSYTISVSELAEYSTPEANTYSATLIERDLRITYEKWLSGSIVFDKSISDPENISGDINSGYIAVLLSKFRRCLCKKTAEGSVSISYLSDTNSNFYEDGTAATLTGAEGDVMVDFPAFYYKYESVDDNKFRYTFAESNIDGSYYYVERSLVGAYKGYISSSKLYSISGVASTGSVSQANFLAYAEARGTGYQIIDFQQHCVIAFMLYAKYGNRNLQAILGVGGAGYSSNNTSGTTNSIGNADTENESGTGNYVNGLGIEGVFGGIYEWVKGVSVTSIVWTITDPDGTVRTKTAGSTSGYITNIAAEDGAPFDVVPTVVGGSETTHYADYYYQSSSGSCVLARSSLSSFTNGGVACSHADFSSSSTDPYYGSRLAFRGVIEEATSVTAFKALSVL